MRRPTRLPTLPRRSLRTPDAWDRHNGWILALFLLIALSTVIPW